MARIFISYRRDDSRLQAIRLRDAIALTFGADSVFLDTASIDYGDRFPKRIEDALRQAKVLIVLIGPDWFTEGADGQPRINDPKDFCRREIEAALERGIRIIPVLVGGAELPPAERLPASIRAIRDSNAAELSEESFLTDVEKLLDALRGCSFPQFAAWAFGSATLAGLAVFPVRLLRDLAESIHEFQSDIAQLRESVGIVPDSASYRLEDVLEKVGEISEFRITVYFAFLAFGVIMSLRPLLRLTTRDALRAGFLVFVAGIAAGIAAGILSAIPSLFVEDFGYRLDLTLFDIAQGGLVVAAVVWATTSKTSDRAQRNTLIMGLGAAVAWPLARLTRRWSTGANADVFLQGDYGWIAVVAISGTATWAICWTSRLTRWRLATLAVLVFLTSALLSWVSIVIPYRDAPPLFSIWGHPLGLVVFALVLSPLLKFVANLTARELVGLNAAVFFGVYLARSLQALFDQYLGSVSVYMGLSVGCYYGMIATSVFWVFRQSGRVPGPGGEVIEARESSRIAPSAASDR
ncbi:MAG: toll/interleukin-1 receptor domain-containing protein [Pseudomonadota bacterium]